MKTRLNRLVENVHFRLWLRQMDPLFYTCALVVTASLVLGGGTRGGFLSDAILQLIALPLLAVSLWRFFEVNPTKRMRVALWFGFALAALPLLQVIPLPSWLWRLLPNRDVSAASLELLGHKLPWMPISVSPQETWLSGLSLIAPLAIFLGTLLLGFRERRWLSLVILAVGVISVFIGLIQVSQGSESPLRFFAITNPTEAVGFFANRNHFAALVYTLILLTSAWGVSAAVEAGSALSRKQYDTASIVRALGCFTLLVVLLAAEAMARSRAGLGLAIVALLGASALGFSDRRVGSSGLTPSKLLFGAVALAVLFAVQFTLYRILERFQIDPIEDARVSFVHNAIQAAKAYMPVGSGLGSFVPVYGLFERPQDTLVNAYVNHAHNDLVEMWLEAGVLGLVLMALFAIWLVLRSVEIWRSTPPLQACEVDWSLARAATIVIVLIAVHSFFDYPLRTGAMAAVMAFACALLIEPPVSDLKLGRSGFLKNTRDQGISVLKPSPAPMSLTPTSRQPKAPQISEAPPRAERWGTDVQWPEEWRKSSEPRSPEAKGKPSS